MDPSESNPRRRTAPIFRAPETPAHGSGKHPSHTLIPSSSPAFATPAFPVRNRNTNAISVKRAVVPITLSVPLLRPLAFRIFTKKHALTLTSSALASLATFIGRHCGKDWQANGSGESVLDEVAAWWKKSSSDVLVDGETVELKNILRNLEGCMDCGLLVASRSLSRQNSLLSRQSSSLSASFNDGQASDKATSGAPRPLLGRDDSQTSLGFSSLAVDEDEDHADYDMDDRGGEGLDDEHEEAVDDIRHWLKYISAFEQPRLTYNVGRKHFERASTPATMFPPPSAKTTLFRNRYNLIYQRLLRNETFQTSALANSQAPSLRRSASMVATVQQSYKLTPVANLLGRNGSAHLLLGLLTMMPSGTLAIGDLTGTIALDVRHARSVPEDGAWFCPGMIVLVDGVYEEEQAAGGAGLGGGNGVGGTIGGRFVALTVGGPPCERRDITLGLVGQGPEGEVTAGGGFGWTDFLDLGSEKATGPKMRSVMDKVLARSKLAGGDNDDGVGGRERLVVMGEVRLDSAKTFDALRKVLGTYAAEAWETTPMAFVLMGNFTQTAAMAATSNTSADYREGFDALAAALSEFPSLLSRATFFFVPGDNDPWASAFSAGAAVCIPRKPVPDLFASRVKRAFTAANAEAKANRTNNVGGGGGGGGGEAIFTSNPARLSVFGPAQEIVLFRDDISGRLRRNAIRFRPVQAQRHEAATASTPDGSRGGESKEAETMEMEIDHAVETAESHRPKQPDEATSAVPATTSDTQLSRKLTKTLLDQGHLSPFALSTRPVLWDHGSALQLYPLPTVLVLMDAETPPFAASYEACCVLNPGTLVGRSDARRGDVARWAEYAVGRDKARILQEPI
ncbi:MAG: hypothetical protein M1825_003889 [Sarcosagium campestre]|nr:MAG: hypothetical protein M1825_003889 [Sarcosagium campestre]